LKANQALLSKTNEDLKRAATENATIAEALKKTATENALIRQALYIEKERAQVTLNSIGDAVICTAIDGSLNYINRAAEQLTQWTSAAASGRRLEEVLHVVDSHSRDVLPNVMARAMEKNVISNLPPWCILIRPDGSELTIEDSCAPIHDFEGKVSGAVMVFRDVSEARAMALKMSHLAQHDSLTDLPNRVLLNDRLVEAIALSLRYHRKLALLFLDLDDFKHINDSLGHVIGDQLLKSVSRRLFTCVRSSDTVSRYGGDEFVILLWEIGHADDAAALAGKILLALREPHHIKQHELHVTGSIGIVTYPDDGEDEQTLLKKADVAMYNAKVIGGDNYQFFSTDMQSRAAERQLREGDLRRAI
jgi:diguanylate cyclase (GGDEF)-like protein/PAS domain S-box-containing protein